MVSPTTSTSGTANPLTVEDVEVSARSRGLTDELAAQKIAKEVTEQKYTLRERTYNLLNSLQLQVLVLMLVLVDVAILGVEIADDADREQPELAMITLVILIAFAVEIGLKVFIYRPYLFVKDPFNLFDAAIVLVSLAFTLAELSAVGKSVAALRAVKNAYRAIKVLRSMRSIRYLVKTAKQTRKAASHLVGRNKQRYVDLENQIDLDLCYVDDANRLIVMSVPATGRLALFRNPRSEVIRFFEIKHQGSYRIYNCCPEHPYADFGTGCVIQKYDVVDHSPPTIEMLVSFLNDASGYMSENIKNTIAVHCRGGKGRSGSFCCAWLLYTQECATADEALAKFALSRTEWRKSGKLQGVETPSQKRYIYQLDQLLTRQNRYFDSGEKLVVPALKKLSLSSLVLENLFTQPAVVAKQGPLVCVVKSPGQPSYTSKPILHELLTNKAVFDLEGTEVWGDVQISVYQEEKMDLGQAAVKKSGNEKGMLFSFFFHSSFTGADLRIGCKMIDKAVKNKPIGGLRKPYNMNGGVKLVFR